VGARWPCPIPALEVMFSEPRRPPCRDPLEPKVSSLLDLDGVEVVSQELVHLEHVDPGLLEDRLHLVVAHDLALVGRVLQLVQLNVRPQLLDDLRSGQLLSLLATGTGLGFADR
jgi:hypothetical protein